MTPEELGEHLNTVQLPPCSCPRCHIREPMYVFENYAVWQCGHAQRLPPLPRRGNNAATHLAPIGAR